MIDLTAKLDNDEFQRKLQEMRNTAFGVTNSIVKETQRIETAWQGVTNSLNGSEGIGAKLLQGLKPIIPQVEAIRQGVKGIKVDFENIPTVSPLRSMEEATTSATRGFNALNFATQQLVREVPAATMGLHMFFLAISNNLPFFADAIKQVREENKALAASGKPTTSAFKQIINSLFSWQTALVAGITALTLYGKEIGNWVKGLFKGKEAIDAAKEASDGLNAAIEKNGLGIGTEIGKYKSLRREFEAINGDIKEQERFVRDNQSAFDDLGVSINSVIDAENIFSGEGTEAFLKALRLRAEAMAAQKLAVEQYEKALMLEAKAGELPEFVKPKSSNTNITSPQLQLLGIEENNWPSSEMAYNAERKELESEAKAARNVADAYFDIHDAKMKAASDTLEDANIEENDQETQAELRAAELRAKQIANTSARLVADATKAKTQAEIDAMAEGIEKKIAQINLDYDLEEKAITKREEELRKLRGGMITKQEEDAIAAMRSANKANRDRDINAANASESARIAAEAKKSQEAWNEYLIQYGTFKEKQKAITDKYNAEIADAETDGERKALEAKRDAILAEFAVEAEGFGKELADKTAEELSKMIEQLRAQVEAKQEAFDALDSSESVDAKQYQNEINELRAKIKLLEEAAGKAKKEVSNKDWNESVQTFQEIARAANEAADGIAEFDEGLGDTLRSIAQLASAGLNLVTSIKAISDAAWTGAEAISAMEKASVILAAISAAIQVVSAVVNAFKSSDDEVEQTKRQFKELNDELERLHKLARIDSVEGTIFGPNPFGNFINNLKAMQDALKDFEASKEAIRLKDAQYMDVVTGWNADGSAVTMKVPQGRQNLNDAIANMRVKTKDRNWLGEWWYGGDEYANLGDEMPELFDESGNVTLEGLQNLQNSDVWETLGEKDRELIEQMIADWEDYNAAVEANEKYLSDVFGDLGGDLTDALLEAFKNGTDAAEAFGEATGKILDRLASDIVNMALIQPILDKAEADVLELQKKLEAGEITYDEYLRQTKAVVDEAANKAKDLVDDASEIYEAAGVGQDSYSSSATSKGFQTMSQETGSELNGRFTDIQGQTHRIAEAVEFCKSLHIENLTQVQSINTTVAMIHNDTSLIAEHTRALAQMRDDLASIRRSMDNGAI